MARPCAKCTSTGPAAERTPATQSASGPMLLGGNAAVSKRGARSEAEAAGPAARRRRLLRVRSGCGRRLPACAAARLAARAAAGGTGAGDGVGLVLGHRRRGDRLRRRLRGCRRRLRFRLRTGAAGAGVGGNRRRRERAARACARAAGRSLRQQTCRPRQQAALRLPRPSPRESQSPATGDLVSCLHRRRRRHASADSADGRPSRARHRRLTDRRPRSARRRSGLRAPDRSRSPPRPRVSRALDQARAPSDWASARGIGGWQVNRRRQRNARLHDTHAPHIAHESRRLVALVLARGAARPASRRARRKRQRPSHGPPQRAPPRCAARDRAR